ARSGILAGAAGCGFCLGCVAEVAAGAAWALEILSPGLADAQGAQGVRAGASAARVGGHACGYSVGQALSAELAGGGISGSGESFMRADRAGDCSPHSCGGAYGAQERRKAESVEATAAQGAVAQQAAGFGADDPTDIESLPGRRQLPAQAAGAGAAG